MSVEVVYDRGTHTTPRRIKKVGVTKSRKIGEA